MLIKNKTDRNRLLNVDLDSGRTQEISRSETTLPPRKKGFFEKWSKGYMCVLSGESGPFLKIGQKDYSFKSPEWRVEVEKAGTVNIFRLWDGGSLVIEELYKPPSLDDLDPWSDEESEDFFLWLSRKKNDEEFIEMWTDE
ncbi:hypothetical protein [Marinimicrobium sp. LS-A18]|uniref:hypothetical protein n=1 Tax=Marinimicrobium sp. LS-A18 TaxID=1381596 RepID=UPI000464E202|nr:hypothetical protein [Marinimicrobium sp. LS-A18]